MLNPSLQYLTFLFLLWISMPVHAQHYQGVRMVNRSEKQYWDKDGLDFELQIGAKFPNAQAIAESAWLSGKNINNYVRSLSAFTLGYMFCLDERWAIGQEVYLDYNKKQSMTADALHTQIKTYSTLLVRARYIWSENNKSNLRFYSEAGLGIGWRFDTDDYTYFTGGSARYSGSTNRRRFEYQAVLLGVLYGSGHWRLFGELGYGGLYLVKAGVNYTMSLK